MLFALAGFLVIPFVYGSAFNGARAPFVVLTVSSVALGVYVIGGAYTSASGRPGVTSMAMAASAVLNVAFSFMLIPLWGLVGNALATLLASTVASGLILRQIRRDRSLILEPGVVKP